MAIDYDAAVAVQRAHEQELLALDGVSGVGVTQTDDGPVLSVTLDPEAPLPAALDADAIDGVPLRVVRDRFRLQ